MTSLNGYFINLDRSTGRAAQMRAELQARGLGFVERFSAIDARTLLRPPQCAIPMAAYGLFLSHQALIVDTPPRTYTLILEDDVQISEDLGDFLSEAGLARLADYDLVFLDCNAGADINTLVELYRSVLPSFPNPHNLDGPPSQRTRATEIVLHPARWLYRWGATAYLVTPRGKQRLAPWLRDTLDRGPPGPLDILYRDLIEAGTIDAAVAMPFLATPTIEGLVASTIEGRDQSFLSSALMNMIRRLFFAGPIDGIADYLAPVLPGPLPEDRAELMAVLVGQIVLGLLRDKTFTIL